MKRKARCDIFWVHWDLKSKGIKFMWKKQKENILSHYNHEMEILNRCAKTLSETCDPEEFFSNYDLYMDKLKILSDAEFSGIISVSGDSFCEKYKQKCSDNVNDINEFIDRVWTKTNGNEEEYLKTFDAYIHRMPLDSIPHFLSLITNPEVIIKELPAEFKNHSQSRELWKPRQNVLLYDEPIPIENRTAGLEPSCDGLYPHEVLVLSYAHRYFIDGNEFPGFWWYKYGIEDVQKLLDTLLQKGYIKAGTTEDAVKAEKLTTIKETLKEYNLKTTGKKDALVQLLVSNVQEDVLSQIFVKRPYILTSMGQEVLKRYEWIPYIHAHKIGDLDIWNLTQLIQDSDCKNYRDCIWKYLNDQGAKHIYEKNYGLYRNCCFEMAEFLLEEDRAEDAFFQLCKVCFFDLSGLSNGFSNTTFERELIIQYCFPYETSITTVAPGIIDRIKKCQNFLCWDKEMLKEELYYAITDITTLFQLFSNEEMVTIIMEELDNNKNAVSKIYDIARQRFE